MRISPQRVPRRVLVIGVLSLIHDALAGAVSLALAYYLRLGDFAIGPLLNGDLNLHLALFAFLAATFSWLLKLNARVWRFSSMPELVTILKVATLTLLSFAVLMFLLTRLDTIPRSTLIISWCLLTLLLGLGRFAYRAWRTERIRLMPAHGTLKPVVLVGVSQLSELFIKTIDETGQPPFQIVAALDERNRRTGQSLRGINIIGSLEDLASVIEGHRRDGEPLFALVLTKPHHAFNRAWLDQLLKLAAEQGVKLLHVPDITELEGTVGGLKAQPLRIEDLLNRRPVHLDSQALERFVGGATVAVTGAGGSIGSEMCRQIVRLKPSRLILLELSEFNLVEIEREMRQLAPDTEIEARIVDVRDRARVMAEFQLWRPSVVFHAAALKHVPVVELQPVEGIHTNVVGTRNVADAALETGARAMVLISTDKVVNPTNVMGATKRVAELYCQSLDVKGATQFITVRFGNVMGSTGSVVPIFEAQIAKGGPVTVTHPEITRYFMTIPEAAQLVLHAMRVALETSSLRGRIFVLDMGEPVKIRDLARRMILLTGRQPDVDIAIEFTGLRPGEKLYEELFTESERLTGSTAQGVLVGSPEARSHEDMARLCDDLERAVRDHDAGAGVALLRTAVPDARLTGTPAAAGFELGAAERVVQAAATGANGRSKLH